MQSPTRREFLLGATGLFGLAALPPARAQFPAARLTFDTLIAGGRVIDPSQGVDAVADVGITGGRVEAVGVSLPREGVRRVIDARGKLVTPGLIDVHVHVYPGVPSLGIDPDLVGVTRGVTTVVDAGSVGATSFAGFREHVVARARTRVFGMVNVSRTGMTVPNEYERLEWVDVDAAVRAVERHRGVAVGFKARMLAGTEGSGDLEVARRAREAADRAQVPLTLHIGGQTSPLPRILEHLRPGDVLTHAFRRTGSILDANGRVYPEVHEAVSSGVWLDIGHGMGNLDFDVAERILDQGVEPQLISSDVHDGNVIGPVFDLPTNLSKFMALGMPLDRAVAACTSTAAQVFDYGVEVGTLRPGAPADLAVFDLVEGEHRFTDATGGTRTGSLRLVPWITLRDGLPYGVARG